MLWHARCELRSYPGNRDRCIIVACGWEFIRPLGVVPGVVEKSGLGPFRIRGFEVFPGSASRVMPMTRLGG